MRLFGGIKLTNKTYDPSRDSGLELVQNVVASGSSEREARSKLETEAKKLGATVIFGLTSRQRGPYYDAFGSAYRPKPKPGRRA